MTDPINAFFKHVIHNYSRAQAVDDGVLIDVSDPARQAGFRAPVAITARAWADCVQWSDSDSQKQVRQDEAGRLWDVLWMSYLATRRAAGNQVAISLYRVPRDGLSVSAQEVRLQMHIGPGDDGSPVITIMALGED